MLKFFADFDAILLYFICSQTFSIVQCLANVAIKPIFWILFKSLKQGHYDMSSCEDVPICKKRASSPASDWFISRLSIDI